MIIQSKNVYIDEQFQAAALLFEDGKITKILDYNGQTPDVDYGDQKILPGLVNIHCHGYAGMDANYSTHEGLRLWQKDLAKEGVTTFLVTTSTAEEDDILNSFKIINEVKNEHNFAAEIYGIHVEGPHISFPYRGAHDPYLLRKPDVEEFIKWQKVAENNIKLICIAPECDKDHHLIKYCADQDVKVTIGHTAATYEECLVAIKDGAGSFTHAFNGMVGVHHRKPGTAGAAMSVDEAYAELICDGVHVHFALCKALARSKGKDRLILITDEIQIKGLKPGIYELSGQWIEIGEDGAGRLKDGTLSGSSAKLINMVKNLIEECDIDEVTAINAATINPCKFINIPNKGLIKEGYDADVIVINEDYEVLNTYLKGELF